MDQPPGPAMPSDELRGMYLAAIYEVDFASGTRQFRAGEPADAAPAFAIVTAWNPRHERPSREENDAANMRLEAALEDEGYCYVSARGYNREHTHEELSFAIVGIEPEDALAFARRFGQAAIFSFDGRSGRVLFT